MRLRNVASLVALAFAGTALAPLHAAELAALPGAQAAQAPSPPAAQVPSDLPRNARPMHYTIGITPDAAALKFNGTAAVEIEVLEPSDAITLHAVELAFAKATLIPATGGKPLPLNIALDSAKQTVRFSAANPLKPGRYRLETSYSGIINTQANGLFALDYQDAEGKDKRALFTQFEAPDARRFAPMFDEPIYKATFDLTATIPANQMAVSNMPVLSERDLGNGRKKVTFSTSPKMSSYLLFFALGDFERISKKLDNGVEVGIVAPAGSGEQGRLALDEMAPIIPYFSNYFGQPYPLPKLDNVAGPGQSQFFGAMENWGAIFTFQRGLLNDPRITSPERREYIVATQNHEVAHQWFGNLVTMAWWDDLWLNEGFASWMETKATDHFHPDWYPLLGRVGGREEAMAQDAFRTTHPIVQPIRTVEEINQAFDSITYNKGEAVISMLEAYAGETAWRDGLRAYMAAHKFGNTRSDDLWNAVERAGAPGLTAIARDFITQPGIPLVSVGDAKCEAGKTTATLTQAEFTRDRVGQPSQTRWRVPLLVSAGGAPVRSILSNGSATVTVDGCGPLLVNTGQLGYFRSLYTPAAVTNLRKGMGDLKPIDQLGLVRDQLELSEAGYQPMAPALDLLTAVSGDANPVVAKELLRQYGAIYSLLGNDTAAKQKLLQLAVARYKPRLDQLGLEPRDGESLSDSRLRAQLIDTFGRMGEPSVAASARERFARLANDPRSMDGPLKTAWLNIVARNASPAEWDQLAALAKAATSPVEKADYFSLLGASLNKTLAQQALDLSLTDAPGKTNSSAIMTRVAGLHPELAFDFVLANRAKVETLIDASGRGRFYQRITQSGDTQVMADKVSAFAETLDADVRKPLDAALAAIRDRLATTPRIAKETALWLKKAK